MKTNSLTHLVAKLFGYALLTSMLLGCATKDDRSPETQQLERFIANGNHAHQQGQLQRADGHYVQALRLARSLDDLEYANLALLNRAENAYVGGRWRYAYNLLQQLHLPLQASYTSRYQLLIARLQLQLGDSPEVIEQAQQQLSDLSNQNELATALRLSALSSLLAQVAAQHPTEHSVPPARNYQQLLANYRTLQQQAPSPSRQARLLRHQAQAPETSNPEARRLTEQALAIYQQQYERPALAATLTELAKLAEEPDQAISLQRRALNIRIYLRDPARSSELIQSLAEHYQQQGLTNTATLWRQLAADIDEDFQAWSWLERRIAELPTG